MSKMLEMSFVFSLNVILSMLKMSKIDQIHLRVVMLCMCVGLNPLSRTIQGNDPGTTACPPSAQAGIG